MKTCKDCKYCTEKRINVDEQIGLCTDTHTPTDAAGNHKMQIRLNRQACMWFAENVIPSAPEKKKQPVKSEHKAGD